MQCVVHVNTSTSWGGLEQYTLTMIELFIQRGLHVELLCTTGSRLHAEATKRGITVIDGRSGWHVNMHNIRKLRKRITSGQDWVVHSHTRIDVWTASIACAFTSVAHVYSLHMIPVPKRDVLHRLVYGRVDAIVNTCEKHVSDVPFKYNVPPDNVYLIRHIRDPLVYTFSPEQRATYRSEWGVGDEHLVVGYLARIDPLKGTREFVDSMSLLPKELRDTVRYVVVGEPSMRGGSSDGSLVPEPASQALQEWVNEQSLSQPGRLIARPFTTDVAGVLSAFDVFVLATYGEMYALSVLEAMLVGVPVIGTNTDGTPDQLANGRGLLVNSRSAQAIADGVLHLVQNPQQRVSMAAAARAWAISEFNPQQVVPQWLQLYTDVSQKRRNHK